MKLRSEDDGFSSFKLLIELELSETMLVILDFFEVLTLA
jgi:hypothetical protein